MAYLPSVFLVFLFVQAGLSDICVEHTDVYPLVDDVNGFSKNYEKDFFKNYGYDFNKFYDTTLNSDPSTDFGFYLQFGNVAVSYNMGNDFFKSIVKSDKNVDVNKFGAKNVDADYRKDSVNRGQDYKTVNGKDDKDFMIYGKDMPLNHDKNVVNKDFVNIHGKDVKSNVDQDNMMRGQHILNKRDILNKDFVNIHGKDMKNYNVDHDRDFVTRGKDLNTMRGKDLYDYDYSKDFMTHGKDIHEDFMRKDMIKDYDVDYDRYYTNRAKDYAMNKDYDIDYDTKHDVDYNRMYGKDMTRDYDVDYDKDYMNRGKYNSMIHGKDMKYDGDYNTQYGVDYNRMHGRDMNVDTDRFVPHDRDFMGRKNIDYSKGFMTRPRDDVKDVHSMYGKDMTKEVNVDYNKMHGKNVDVDRSMMYGRNVDDSMTHGLVTPGKDMYKNYEDSLRKYKSLHGDDDRDMRTYKKVDENVNRRTDADRFGDYKKHFVDRSDKDKSYRKEFFKDNFFRVKTREECACVCPSTMVKGDLTDAHVMDLAQKDLLNKMWNNRHMPKLSVGGRRMKNLILMMANSDTPAFQQHAYIMSSFFFTYFPYSHLELDLCPFTMMMNASNIYEKTHDSSVAHEAADMLSRTGNFAVRLLASDALRSSGCGIVKPQIIRNSCSMDYDFDLLWDREGSLMPTAYRHVAFELHRSSYYPDRLMAAIASSALTQIFRDLVGHVDKYAIFEVLNMQATETVKDCCCAFRQHRLQELVHLVDNDIVDMVKHFKLDYTV